MPERFTHPQLRGRGRAPCRRGPGACGSHAGHGPGLSAGDHLLGGRLCRLVRQLAARAVYRHRRTSRDGRADDSGNILTRPPVAEALSIGVYLASCASIIALGEATRTAQRRLEDGKRQLSSANLALETRVEAQSLVAAIVASSDAAIISTTLEGRITSWNKGAERLFGYTAAEAVGRSVMMLVPPDQHDQELSLLARMREGPRAERLEVMRVTNSGQRRDLSLTVSPAHDRHGHTMGASTTARDVTERKVAEARLPHSEEAHRLLLGIHDATRGLHDPAMVMQEIVTRAGLHFEVARCAYGEVDTESEVIEITRGYTNGVPLPHRGVRPVDGRRVEGGPHGRHRGCSPRSADRCRRRAPAGSPTPKSSRRWRSGRCSPWRVRVRQ
ncbi:MAG: PAS domain S-box protein [Acidobacteria bacterium]|nr:PAS domain S-box protein [Acidobacteriota bacterium]